MVELYNQIIRSSPAYTYRFGLLAKATSVIPIFSASSTPEFMGALLLTRTGKPALAALATITPDSLPLVIKAQDPLQPEEPPQRSYPLSWTG